MAEYINLACNPVAPVTIRDKTAQGIIGALVGTGWTSGVVVDAAIIAAGGTVASKSYAVKALRNIGYPLIVEGRGQWGFWKLADTPAELEQYRKRVVRETFSQHVTVYRPIAGMLLRLPGDPVLRDSWRAAQSLGITLGTDPAIGLDARDVLDTMDVLTP